MKPREFIAAQLRDCFCPSARTYLRERLDIATVGGECDIMRRLRHRESRDLNGALHTADYGQFFATPLRKKLVDFISEPERPIGRARPL